MYQSYTFRLYKNIHTRGIFYLLRLALCSPNLPMAGFLSICIVIYCACDVRTTSRCVMPSVTERSFFRALYTSTAAKITISVDYWSK